jgi:hypothetical protein
MPEFDLFQTIPYGNCYDLTITAIMADEVVTRTVTILPEQLQQVFDFAQADHPNVLEVFVVPVLEELPAYQNN